MRLLPEPTSPAMPRISARRHVKVSPSGPVPGSCTPVTSSIGSGRAVVARSGNAWSIGRPTIAETTWSRVVDRIGRVQTTAPSRSTVISSAIRSTSDNRWLM